jgi:sporulation inhibitor KapD
MSKDFFVVDLEFTHYAKRTGKPRGFFSEIIEIGAVRIDRDTNEITGHIQDFVKPHFYPDHAKESMAVSMITDMDMKTAIDFTTMLEMIETLYIPGETYFVTWGGADVGVIRKSCERHGLPNPISHEDRLDLAEAYRLWYGGSGMTSLQNAVDEQNIIMDGLWHTAYGDAIKTSKILQLLLADDWSPEEYTSGMLNT